MPDSKISGLTTLVTPASEDLVVVIDNPNGTPVSKKITLKELFENIPSNTSISGIFTSTSNATFSGSNTNFSSNVTVTGSSTLGKTTVSSNGIVITTTLTPANSTISGVATGKIFYDTDYLYIRVSNTAIKRVALSSF